MQALEHIPLTSNAVAQTVRHFFTVDVEEYFQVNAFERAIPRDDWSRWPSRLEHNMGVVLELLERRQTLATFFVLGWIAERMPQVVRAISSAGHEVASHGYSHRRAFTMSPQEFRDDVRASKAVLEGVVGQPVVGYRAPSFSIIPGAEWTLDVLLEEGFSYDSSLFPVRRRGYGYPSAPRNPHLIRRRDGTLAEFPLATARVGGIELPASGGGYLRHFPLSLIRRAFRQAEARKSAATFYIHPWEIDPQQPRVPVSTLTRLRHYRGLRGALARVDHMLTSFRFGPIGPELARVEALAGAR
jgi:polysaccharide deacetylase family protein (PEP-CTERM system associated)